MRGDLDVVSLGHFTDGLVTRPFEALDEACVGMGVYDRSGSSVGARSDGRVFAGSLLPLDTGVFGRVHEVVPRCRQGGEAIASVGEH